MATAKKAAPAKKKPAAKKAAVKKVVAAKKPAAKKPAAKKPAAKKAVVKKAVAAKKPAAKKPAAKKPAAKKQLDDHPLNLAPLYPSELAPASTAPSNRAPMPVASKKPKATKKNNAPTKLFVLDTNVLMHDSMCLFLFEEHDVYLPMTTLEELDGAGPEFALALIRRDEIGCAEIIAELPEDIALIERAARKLFG